MKELISDKIYEKSMVTRLGQTCQLMQEMVDAYNSLDLQPCNSASELYNLSFHPAEMVAEGRYKKKADCEGLTPAQKEKYLAGLVWKNPNPFYELAKKVSEDAYAETGQGLFLIIDGKVTLNTERASSILKAKSVIVSRPEQEVSGKDLKEFHRIFNRVNKASYGSLATNLAAIFTPSARGEDDTQHGLNIHAMREILKNV